MPFAIAMPKLGMTMKEGTVLEWRARPGETVVKGQVVLLIESEKTEVELEAPANGVLRQIYIEPDALVPCGRFLAAFTETADESFDAESFRGEHERAEVHPARPSARAPAIASGRQASNAPSALPRPSEPPVVPAARRRAKDLDVELARVVGSGPNGRVSVEDVEAFASQMPERVEVAPGVRLEVPCQGAGETVLLLPGFGSDVSSFSPQIAALAASFRVCGVNPRGVGFSSAPVAQRYDVSTTASDAAALIGSTAHLIGASLGAAAAIELALGRPDAVRSLVLLTPFVTATPRLLAVVDAWSRLAAAAPADAVAAALLPWLYGSAFLSDAGASGRAAKALAAGVSNVPATTLLRQAAGLRAWSGTRADALERLQARTLLIAAEDDLLTPGAAEIAKRLPDCALLVVPGAGHAVGIEAGEVVTRAILAHLRDR